MPQALKNKTKGKINGQVSNSAKAVKINCPFEQANLSDGVSNHYGGQNLDVLNVSYVSTSRWLTSSERSGKNFGCLKFWHRVRAQGCN